LFSQRNGFTTKSYDTAFEKAGQELEKEYLDTMSQQKTGLDALGHFVGAAGRWAYTPETIIELMTPLKIKIAKIGLKGVGSTIKEVGKSFGYAAKAEAPLVAIAEASRQIRVSKMKERLGMKYTIWDSMKEVLYNVGGAVVLRGLGSATVDMVTVAKVKGRIKAKGVDVDKRLDIVDRFIDFERTIKNNRKLESKNKEIESVKKESQSRELEAIKKIIDINLSINDISNIYSNLDPKKLIGIFSSYVFNDLKRK
jgi:hypothetical protein